SLQSIGIERQAYARQRCKDTGTACDCRADAIGSHASPARLDAGDPPARPDEILHFAVLDDIDAEAGCRPRIAPCHGIMTRGAGARLENRSEYRVACMWGEIEQGRH